MKSRWPQLDHSQITAEFHLLGQVDFDVCHRLQRRLMYEAGGTDDRQITILFCEHQDLITVGKAGSRAHIRWYGEDLKRRQLAIRWVARSGGCVFHTPGQLAVYVVAPLARLGWSLAEFRRRLYEGIHATLTAMNVPAESRHDALGIVGRTGLLATEGVYAKDGVARGGFFINVCPDMRVPRRIDTAPAEAGLPKRTMSCLLAERGRSVTMSKVRSNLIDQLVTAMDATRHHLYSGHPLLQSVLPSRRETARAS
jgi:lipoyl(octanoyl) transferase